MPESILQAHVRSPLNWLRIAEKSDLKLLVFSALLIPLTWVVLLKWNGSDLLTNHDGVAMVFPIVQDLVAQDGDWERVLYRPQIMGGAVIHDTGSLVPAYSLFAWLGFSPIATVNLSLLLIQLLVGFFVARASQDFSLWWQRSDKDRKAYHAELDLATHLGLVWLACFSPLLAWRISWGHPNIALGMLGFLVPVALIGAIANYRWSYTLIVVSIFSLFMAIPTAGQQIFAYTVVFWTIPLTLLLGTLFVRWKKSRGVNHKATTQLFIAFGLLFVAGLGLSMPRFAGIVAHAFADDQVRSLTNSDFIYSYLPFTWRDLITSINWSVNLIPTGKPPTAWHDFNFPIGPLALILIIAPWGKFRRFAAAAAVTSALSLAFAMNIPPVGQIFPKLFPILNGFRCPQRTLIPIALLGIILACASILYHYRGRQKLHPIVPFATIGLALLMVVFPAPLREILAWFIAAACTAGAIYKHKERWDFGPVPFLILLGTLSVAGFRDRLLPFIPEAALTGVVRTVGSELKRTVPELNMPLTRSLMKFDLAGMIDNVGFALGLSDINGYWFPTRRYLELTSSLDKSEVVPMVQIIRVRETTHLFTPLQQLYNMRFSIALEPERQINVKSLGVTAGPAWFSTRLTPLPSYQELGNKLNAAEKKLSLHVAREAWYLSNDPRFAQVKLPANVSEKCEDAKILQVQTRDNGQHVTLDVNSPAECPLTLSMNYASILAGYQIDAAENQISLPLFPTYGALTGMMAPHGARQIIVKAEPQRPWWARVSWYIGVVASLLTLLCYAKLQGIMQEQKAAIPKSRNPTKHAA